MNNHKGFSLIELIVAISILSVVILGISLMLSSGSNMFSSITRSEKTRADMLVALAQIQERAIDCDGVCVDDGDLLIARADDDAVYCISYNADTKTLNLSESTVQDGALVEQESGILCRNVNAFSVAVEDGLLSSSLSIRNLNETKFTALRNAVIADTQADLISAIFPEEG